MLKTTGILNEELKNYANPGAVIRRMTDSGQLIKVRHGLYETDSELPGICLAVHIYGPSYLSFDFALAYYGLIPEAVTRYTCASFRKHKSKEYHTPFGIFSYRDVPETAYPWGIDFHTENGYPYLIASPEKALCDKLYIVSPRKNRSEMETLLFEDLRIDRGDFQNLDFAELMQLSSLYQTVSHRVFRSFIQKELMHGRNH